MVAEFFVWGCVMATDIPRKHCWAMHSGQIPGYENQCSVRCLMYMLQRYSQGVLWRHCNVAWSTQKYINIKLKQFFFILLLLHCWRFFFLSRRVKGPPLRRGFLRGHLPESFSSGDVLLQHACKNVVTQCLSGDSEDLQSFSKFRRKTLHPQQAFPLCHRRNGFCSKG